jgi:hypothetical protein
VQTTAPISPGSSGGGLFDARGNLIGVTTLVLVGREHLNQSLNFAIPADRFGQPLGVSRLDWVTLSHPAAIFSPRVSCSANEHESSFVV